MHIKLVTVNKYAFKKYAEILEIFRMTQVAVLFFETKVKASEKE